MRHVLWLCALAACGDNGAQNLPPVLESATRSISVSITEGGSAVIDVDASDPEGEPLVYSATAPAHGKVTSTAARREAGSQFLYTPDADFGGSDVFAIEISDGEDILSVPVFVTVGAVNDAPIASDLEAQTNEAQGVAIALTASDVDSASLTYAVVAQPAHGTITGVFPNITYTPSGHYYGTDSFTYQASDGWLASNVATVAIEIANVLTCGDGIVEGAEQCDDGNQSDTDACLKNCMVATCGDGAQQAGVEACDDGNGDNSDTCLSTCTVATCGDGFTQAGVEPCDDGNLDQTDGCLVGCVVATCGDGFTQTGVEQCDDANTTPTDACNACTAAVCGDGIVQAGIEDCDDGNADDTDGCLTTCELPAPPVCGDGKTQGTEECDDGNANDNDGCGRSCLVERCGDGLVQFSRNEQCDDGNTTDNDGCSSACVADPFVTTTPVAISAALSCTTSVANAARKVAVDSSGRIYAVLTCGSDTYAVFSADRGLTFSAPAPLSTDLPGAPVTVSQSAISSGPSGVAYAAMMLNTGAVYLRTTEDGGVTWKPAVLVGTAMSASSGLSLQSFNDEIFVGYSASGGVAVARNATRGTGTFDVTTVAMTIAYFDVLYDAVTQQIIVAADTPTFHIRASSDFGATFAAEVNPPGQEYYSDWAFGGGKIFVSGTNLGASGGATQLYIIPTSALGTSTSVSGLPAVTTAQTRTVTADAGGNAFILSQLNSGGVQLDYLPSGANAFSAPRTLSNVGGSPIAAPLPGNQGVAVVYTEGTSVYATIQSYVE